MTAVAVALTLLAPAETQTLSKGWQVQSSAKVSMAGDALSMPQADVTGWYDATVPSTIMGVLTANGVEPEALTAEDYQRIDKTRFDVSWWYRTGQPLDLHRRSLRRWCTGCLHLEAH